MQRRFARSGRLLLGFISLSGLIALGMLLSSSHVHAHHESGGVEDCVACGSASSEDSLTIEQAGDLDLPQISEQPEIDPATLRPSSSARRRRSPSPPADRPALTN